MDCTYGGRPGLHGLSSRIVLALTKLDDKWDKRHGFAPGGSIPLDLIAVSLGISTATVSTLCCLSYGLFGLLMAADFLLGWTTNPSNKPKNTYPWPASWKTNNTVCYHDMFSEPSRLGCVLRRPGNTLSNVNYLLSSLCVLASIGEGTPSAFWIADGLFVIMLLLLAVFSTIWHASNAPWSQYDDIWSMDCCILYLLIRHCCMGGCKILMTHGITESEKAKDVAGSVCLLVYTILVIGLGKLYGKLRSQGYLHNTCPFSGRARLLGKGNLWGQGQRDCFVSTICEFAILPVIYTGIPTLIQVFLLDSVGSVTAANCVVRTLAIGWTYRLCDRWVLDGCYFMTMFSPLSGKPKWLCSVGAAIFSPTAVLHFVTGVTLLAGYAHCRSVEEEAFG